LPHRLSQCSPRLPTPSFWVESASPSPARSAVRQLVVQTKDGLATIPSGNLSGSGSVLIAAEGSASGAATGE